jgi:hypothetical protein
MKTTTQTACTTLAIAALLALAACGGGGGSGGGSSSTGAAAPASGASTPSTTSSAISANVSTPQYAASSAQLAAFNLLNTERQQCGFPALVENTQLDTAAANHAKYMSLNGGAITDTEVSGNAGFTGTTYAARATFAGYPGASVYVGGVSAGFYTNATLTETQYGQNLVYAWLSGVYHIAIAAWPVTQVGVGESEITFNGFPQVQGSLTIANLQPMTTSGPLTFPCQGTTGIAYSGNGETPVPPNTSGAFGAPVAVTGNPTDTIVLTSGTMTSTSGPVINLNLLDSANDPNKELPTFEAVAYSSTPLTANTTYTVAIAGTDNGTAFSRTFTFTTGNIAG